MNENLISSLICFKKIFYSLVSERCKKFNLNSAELFLLDILYRDGDLHQIEIARILECDKSHIHRITTKLISKELLEFVECQHGKNQKLHITDKGKEIASSFNQIILSINEIIYKNVSKNDLKTVQKTIDTLSDNIMKLKNEEKNKNA